MLYILLSCVLLPFLYIFSLTYSCTHSPDFMFYDCALTCYTTTMMTMMYSHCIHRGMAHSIYTYFLGRVKGFFFWFSASKIVSLSNYIGSNLVLLSSANTLLNSFLDGILACLHFIPSRYRSSSYTYHMGKLSSESALIRKLMWKKKK